MKSKVISHVLFAVVYVGLVYGILSAANSKFETLVLAILVQIYTATLYNFSIIGAATDVNNYAGFVRFRILATAQAVTEDEGGLFVDQERTLRECLDNNRILIMGVVSAYALYKIFAAVVFA